MRNHGCFRSLTGTYRALLGKLWCSQQLKAVFSVTLSFHLHFTSEKNQRRHFFRIIFSVALKTGHLSLFSPVSLELCSDDQSYNDAVCSRLINKTIKKDKKIINSEVKV